MKREKNNQDSQLYNSKTEKLSNIRTLENKIIEVEEKNNDLEYIQDWDQKIENYREEIRKEEKERE